MLMLIFEALFFTGLGAGLGRYAYSRRRRNDRRDPPRKPYALRHFLDKRGSAWRHIACGSTSYYLVLSLSREDGLEQRVGIFCSSCGHESKWQNDDMHLVDEGRNLFEVLNEITRPAGLSTDPDVLQREIKEIEADLDKLRQQLYVITAQKEVRELLTKSD